MNDELTIFWLQFFTKGFEAAIENVTNKLVKQWEQNMTILTDKLDQLTAGQSELSQAVETERTEVAAKLAEVESAQSQLQAAFDELKAKLDTSDAGEQAAIEKVDAAIAANTQAVNAVKGIYVAPASSEPQPAPQEPAPSL